MLSELHIESGLPPEIYSIHKVPGEKLDHSEPEENNMQDLRFS